MEQRRFLLFLALSMAVLMGWSALFSPRPNPQQGPGDDEQVVQREDPEAAGPEADQADAPAQPGEEGPPGETSADRAAAADAAPAGAAAEPSRDAPGAAREAEQQAPALPDHPREILKLGSDDPDSGYFAQVTLTSQGAAVGRFELNDPRYRRLDDGDAPLPVVGDSDAERRTLATSVPQIERQLAEHGTGLRQIDWKVVGTSTDPQNPNILSGVTFGFTSPDGQLEVRKRYELKKVPLEGRDPREVRDRNPAGYQLRMALTVRNRGAQPQPVQYVLQGPVGVPLENVDYAWRYRNLRMGFLSEGGEVSPNSMTAEKVVETIEGDDEKIWKRPFRYIGVDVQYFAALLLPREDQLETPYIEVARPVLVQPNPAEPAYSDISVELTSHEIELPPGGEETHSYALYAGPKRQELLQPLGAEGILDFGWFGFIARGMLSLLHFFHDTMAIPYGIAIICLTILVRGCLFPLSRKQALSAQKMKELQPKISELKKKYGNDKEKMARAQMELFSKHNYNPFAGCLPLLLQFPIFIGLYTALRNSVELRRAPFLWVENLAAPDALFGLPFTVPFLGWTAFNLLPILAAGLFIVQQKLYMPTPAADDEQAQMQQKMMTFMPVVMGFIFYQMPAGLCLYFVATSVWSLGERKLLDLVTSKSGGTEGPAEPAEVPAQAGKKKAAARKNQKPQKKSDGLWAKLLEAAEAAQEQRADGKAASGKNAKNAGRRKKKKSKPRP